MEVEKSEWLAQMEGILEMLNEGVIIADNSLGIVFTNSVFQQMTGFSKDAMLGQRRKNLRCFTPPGLTAAPVQEMWQSN